MPKHDPGSAQISITVTVETRDVQTLLGLLHERFLEARTQGNWEHHAAIRRLLMAAIENTDQYPEEIFKTGGEN